MTRYVALMVLALVTAACALPLNQQYRPVMDLKGKDDHAAAYGSILGVAGGAGSSAGDQISTYKHALRKCLAGRGYQVLN